MKCPLIILLLALLALPLTTRTAAAQQHTTLPMLLDRLDETIDNRESVIMHKEEKIQQLRTLLTQSHPSARLEIAETLFQEYKGYRTDSALHYAQMVFSLASLPDVASTSRQQRALIELATCYSVYGNYTRADNTLSSIVGELKPENRAHYYNALLLLYIWRADFARQDEERDRYYQQVIALRDSAFKYETDPFMRIQQHSLARLDSDLQSAKDELRATMPRIEGKAEYERYLCNSLASCYKRLGMRDSACYYYALSAIADMKCGVQEHASLRELALLLFDTGDVNRAYRYTNTCLEDAQRCGAQLRMTQMAGDMPRIMTTYQNLVTTQKRLLYVAIAILAIFLLIIGGYSLYVYRMAKRLHHARQELLNANDTLHAQQAQLAESLDETRSANKLLHDANLIKESFVAQYMAQCMRSLEQLEAYRHRILHIATGGTSMNKLIAELRDSSMADAEHKAFIDRFDRSFLALFPTFVGDFNALLTPEERIVLPEGKLMNTELRIFALIRLGITDSEEIAAFLRHSVKTIYNYRSKIRNRAIGNRDNLEAELSRIGSITVRE